MRSHTRFEKRVEAPATASVTHYETNERLIRARALLAAAWMKLDAANPFRDEIRAFLIETDVA